MKKQQYELIRASLQASIQDPGHDGDSPSDAQALIDACKALADDPRPALLQALGMFAVSCLVSHQKFTLIADTETSRLLHRL